MQLNLIKGAIAQVLYTRSVIHNYLNTSNSWKQLLPINYCSLCALFRVLVSIRKALGIDSTDSAVFCVSRAVVSEREQETCCSPEPVHTRTTLAIAPLTGKLYIYMYNVSTLFETPCSLGYANTHTTHVHVQMYMYVCRVSLMW